MNFNISNPITINYRKNRRGRHIICGNCGRKGHVYKECLEPIISIGIIAFQKDEDRLKYLMIRRKDTHGYVEFLRGKYDKMDTDYLLVLFNEMTIVEKQKISTQDFLSLWKELWLIENTVNTKRREYVNSCSKFSYLSQNGDIANLVAASVTTWDSPEWGFPKGKRNIREDNLTCAHREFQEETGLESTDYIVFDNIKPFQEVFYGSNSIKYKHIYYIGKILKKKEITINKNSWLQVSEIGDIGFFSLHDCEQKIRPYSIEKKKVLSKIDSVVHSGKLFNRGFEFKSFNTFYNVKPCTI